MSGTAVGVTTGEGVGTGTTAGEGSTGAGGGATGTGEGGAFVARSDGAASGRDCDVWAQDCAPGEKCVFFNGADGAAYWNATTCVPVVDGGAGVGEACAVIGGAFSGVDDCADGAWCWDVDAEGRGVCVAFCVGSPEAPMCAAGSFCAVYEGGFPSFCIRYCDPLVQDCGDGEVCVGNTGREVFLCIVDASGAEGQAHDACEGAIGGCDAGLACVEAAAAVECDGRAGGCCEPFCDLRAANGCPGQGQVCRAWVSPALAPAGYEHIGVCMVPA